MILLLGASGYIGKAFANELRRRKKDFIPLSRKQVDYTRFDSLLEFLKAKKPAFVINAAGYTGKPNVDACELDKAGTLHRQHAAAANHRARLRGGRNSVGARFERLHLFRRENCRERKVALGKGFHQAGIARAGRKNPPAIHGFTETDTPNFSFRDGPCSFYSGTKALGEEAIAGIGQSYIWRLRIPFDEFDNARNYLSKVQRYAKVYDNVNSISHRADFVKACLDTWELRAPFGIYNVTNPGFVTTRHVVEQIEKDSQAGAENLSSGRTTRNFTRSPPRRRAPIA